MSTYRLQLSAEFDLEAAAAYAVEVVDPHFGVRVARLQDAHESGDRPWLVNLEIAVKHRGHLPFFRAVLAHEDVYEVLSSLSERSSRAASRAPAYRRSPCT